MARGNIRKMHVEYQDPIKYQLSMGDEIIDMNALIGQDIQFNWTGTINCVACGNSIKKAFGQGFCFPCFRDSPQNSECIIRPELCEAHLGNGRDVEWEEKHHNQPHVVYLALASGSKVGVTRNDQVPTRWIDQGAWKAIKLAEVPYRQLAGEIEVTLKDYIGDKTHWQKMLKNVLATDLDLLDEKDRMANHLPEPLQELISDDDQIWEINYPVIEFPEKVKSINLEKLPEISGNLRGIKGQYLIFDEGRVINVRKYSGYLMELNY